MSTLRLNGTPVTLNGVIVTLNGVDGVGAVNFSDLTLGNPRVSTTDLFNFRYGSYETKRLIAIPEESRDLLVGRLRVPSYTNNTRNVIPATDNRRIIIQ